MTNICLNEAASVQIESLSQQRAFPKLLGVVGQQRDVG